MRACDTSEDSASDTEEEEMDVRGSIRRRNQVEAPNTRFGYPPESTAPRRRMRPSYFSNEPPVRDTERYSPRVVERSRDATAYVRSFYTSASWQDEANEAAHREAAQRLERIRQLHGPGDEPASTSEEEIPPLVSIDSTQSLDRELRDARSLLERLSRREDVSDEFWASVGLTRSFGDPVERLQELERL